MLSSAAPEGLPAVDVGASLRGRPRSLAAGVVAALGARIREGQWPAGTRLPTESALMQAFGVSRTVVREALSQMQAAGLVHTRHGVGTFVAEPPATAAYRPAGTPRETLRDVLAVLELRIGVETEAAGLAAQRRGDEHLAAMRRALADFDGAVRAGQDAVAADLRFHAEIARATLNPHFVQLMSALGARIIPRARLDPPDAPLDEQRRAYLQRVNAEHDSILDAIASGDADAARAAMRTHLANSRERRRRSEQEIR